MFTELLILDGGVWVSLFISGLAYIIDTGSVDIVLVRISGWGRCICLQTHHGNDLRDV